MKVLVLTSRTGGGHDMRARSFKAWAESPALKDLNLDVCLHESLEGASPIYTFGVALYNWIQRTWPSLHHIYFNVLEVLPSCKSGKRMPGKERFLKKLRSFNPDIVLSVHDHLNHGFFDLVRMAFPENPPPCITYCGEFFGGYGFSRHWVNPAADHFFGAVKETCYMAAKLAMPPARNTVGGLLLNPRFSEPAMSSSEREDYIRNVWKLDPSKFILLLATGANAANNHRACLDALFKSGVFPQVVALCGKDEAAKASLDAWVSEHPGFQVRTLGYTEDMRSVMACSSALFARPGTGTTSEAIISGCPIIFNGIGGIMPQEWITVKFFRKHGIDYLARNPKQLARIVRTWMTQPRAFQSVCETLDRLPVVHDPEGLVRKISAFARKQD